MDADKCDDMIAMYRAYNHDMHDTLVTEYETVYETLDALKKAGFKLGIVTTKLRDTVNMGLKLTGIGEFFETVVTLDDVTMAKPDPEPVLLALKQLGSEPAEALWSEIITTMCWQGKTPEQKRPESHGRLKGRKHWQSMSLIICLRK